MNIAALDLNLLRVFDAMMAERNTTRAGERLGLSQPAVSAALGRLRHVTGDPLFLREGNRMVPTEHAAALHAPIAAALRQIEAALSEAVPFDPATAERNFVLAGSDYFSTLLMPPLVGAVREAAPGVTLQMLDHPPSEIEALLRDGRIDLALDRALEVPDWIAREVLFASHLVCVAQAGHPALAGVAPGARIPAELYIALPQVILSMDGGMRGSIDDRLEEAGLTRRIAATLPHFHAVAMAAAAGGVLGNLPVHLAERLAGPLGMSVYLPPVAPPETEVCLYWHRRAERDPGLSWLRGEVKRVLPLRSG